VAAQVSALQQQLAGLPAPVAWHLGCLLGSGAIHMWHLEWSRQLDDQTSVLSLLASAPEFLAVKASVWTLFEPEKRDDTLLDVMAATLSHVQGLQQKSHVASLPPAVSSAVMHPFWHRCWRL
jgi:hypothetical protein